MNELVKWAESLEAAISITKHARKYVWLKHQSLADMLDCYQGREAVWECAQLLREHQFPWRPETQAQILEFDAGRVGDNPNTYMLWVALDAGRCDLVESILTKSPDIQLGVICMDKLHRGIKQLRPVAHLVIERANLNDTNILWVLLNGVLFDIALPYLGNVPSKLISQSCSIAASIKVVENGLCSYEEMQIAILGRMFSAGYGDFVASFLRTVPALPIFVELARNQTPKYLCWYWILYATPEERKQVLSSVKHLRPSVERVMVGEALGMSNFSDAQLDELPRLPTDIACHLLLRATVAPRRLAWPDDSVRARLAEFQLLTPALEPFF